MTTAPQGSDPKESSALELLERIRRDMAWRLSNTGTRIDRSDFEDLLRFIGTRTDELKNKEPQR